MKKIDVFPWIKVVLTILISGLLFTGFVRANSFEQFSNDRSQTIVSNPNREPECLNAQVSAGNDITSCGFMGTQITAIAQNFVSLNWQTTGSGTFSDPSALSTIYFPTDMDIDNGSVELCITAFANPPCLNAINCLTLFFNHSPILISTIPGNGNVTITWNADEIECEGLPDLPPIDTKDSPVGWSIFFNTITINGMDVVAGDEIAIYDGDNLVGKTVLTGPVIPETFQQSLFAYRTVGPQPGYTPGAPFTFVLCSSVAGVVLTNYTYEFTDPFGGFYVGNTFPTIENSYSLLDINFSGGVEKLFNIYVFDQLYAENITGSYLTIVGLENNTQYCFSVKEKFFNGNLSCNSNILCDTPSQTIIQTNSIDLVQGWSGISCYLDPVNNSIVELFSSIQNGLIIIKNLNGDFYQPLLKSELTTWNYSEGYFIKMSSPETLQINGYEPENKNIILQEGWNLIPVLSQTPVDIFTLFGTNLENTEVIKEAAGVLLFWPEMGITTLENLLPGTSYLVKMNQPATITF